MLNDILISIFIGLFIYIATKVINFYYKFYFICKYLDGYQKLNFFNDNKILLFLLKFNKIKYYCIHYFVIPLIKINYITLSLFSSILYLLCKDKFDVYINNNNIVIEKSNENTNSIEEIINNENTNSIEEIINNKNDIELFNKNNINNYDNSLIINHNYIQKINKDNDIDKNFNIEKNNTNEENNKNIFDLSNELKLFNNNSSSDNDDKNEEIESFLINNDKIESIRIDEIDFGENINNIINTLPKINEKVDTPVNNIQIKIGKKKYS
jgi:hypothetical protein